MIDETCQMVEELIHSTLRISYTNLFICMINHIERIGGGRAEH